MDRPLAVVHTEKTGLPLRHKFFVRPLHTVLCHMGTFFHLCLAAKFLMYEITGDEPEGFQIALAMAVHGQTVHDVLQIILLVNAQAVGHQRGAGRENGESQLHTAKYTYFLFCELLLFPREGARSSEF